MLTRHESGLFIPTANNIRRDDRDERNARWEEDWKAHRACPKCGSDDSIEKTCIGVLEPPDTSNTARCGRCQWSGVVDDLVAPFTIESDLNLRCTIRYREESECAYGFEVFKLTVCEQEDQQIAMYPAKEPQPGAHLVADLNDADPELTGTVKWDGCADVDFQPDGILVHFCGEDDFTRLYLILRTIYSRCAQLIDAWDGAPPKWPGMTAQ